MKRIGILTYHCIPNFGAQLQALSTVGYLQRNGFLPIVLNWYPSDLISFYKKRCPSNQNYIQFRFSQENMPVSNLCTNYAELVQEIQRLNFDAILIGSDALFDYTPKKLRYNFSLRYLKKIPINITSNHDIPNPFWGSFNDALCNPIPLLGYAISSQNMPFKSLTSRERKDLCGLLNGFKRITVRDEWTQKMVKSISGRYDIPIVPDPVFAFNLNYHNIPSKAEITSKYHLPENYTLVSFVYSILSREYVNSIIKLVERKTTSECVSFPMPDKLMAYDTKHIINLPLNPIDWYALIKYSDGYIGERMHPIVVCLHNSVPFYCFDQYGLKKTIIPRLWSKYLARSSKIYDVLKRASLLDNWCPYQYAHRVKPEQVVERLFSFPKQRCNEFAHQMEEKYIQEMSTLLQLL